MRNQVAEFALADMSGTKEAAPIGGPRGDLKRVERVRKMFPETWMWYNGTVRYVEDTNKRLILKNSFNFISLKLKIKSTEILENTFEKPDRKLIMYMAFKVPSLISRPL